jgi:hypothetical protein
MAGGYCRLPYRFSLASRAGRGRMPAFEGGEPVAVPDRWGIR